MRTRRLLQFVVAAVLIALLWPRARAESLAEIRAHANSQVRPIQDTSGQLVGTNCPGIRPHLPHFFGKTP